jgi:hypothetical protein
MAMFNAPTLIAASSSNSNTVYQLRKLIAIRHLIQRLLRDNRLFKTKFIGISKDIRKALTYLDFKARTNCSKKGQDFCKGDLIEEKRAIASEALEAISEVITTLTDENEYNPVTILGITMSEEIMNTLIALGFMFTFAVLNKVLDLDNPF